MNRLFTSPNEFPEGGARRPKLTARQFLGKVDGVVGYTTVADCERYLRSLRDSEVCDLQTFIDFARAGTRCDNHIRVRHDAGSRPYRYPKFFLAKGSVGCKLIPEAGMGKLLDDYVGGKVEIGFTLEELVEEVLNP